MGKYYHQLIAAFQSMDNNISRKERVIIEIEQNDPTQATIIKKNILSFGSFPIFFYHFVIAAIKISL